MVVNEWQSKNIMDNIDKSTWEEMSEDWNAYLLERSTSSAVKRRDPFVNMVVAGCVASISTTDRGTLCCHRSRSDQSCFFSSCQPP